VPNFGHSAKSGTCLAKIGGGQTASSAVLFAKCLPFGTQQSNGKIFFFVFWHQIFLKLYYPITNNMLKFGIFSLLFGIFL
jgi:hypothetical protein